MIAHAHYEIDRRIRNYAEALAERGVAVDVFSLRREGDEVAFQRVEGVNVFKIQTKTEKAATPVGYLVRILLFLMRVSPLLVRGRCGRRYDVIHVHNVPDFLVLAALPSKLLGAKVILDIHDLLPEFFCQKFSRSMSSVGARLLLGAEWISVRLADHVIVSNELWRKRVVSRDRLRFGKTSVYLNYPDLTKFQLIEQREEAYEHRIIYPGTISKHHGVDIAVKAMALLKERHPDAELHIYGRPGSDGCVRYLKELIERLHLEDQVHLLGSVSHEELKKAYQEVGIGVVPKRPGIFASEAFSTKIFDFFASGLPAVVSRTAVDEYYFDESQVEFFEPEDVTGLAKAIELVMENRPLREKLIANGARYAREHCWEAKKQSYIDLLNSLITDR